MEQKQIIDQSQGLAKLGNVALNLVEQETNAEDTDFASWTQENVFKMTSKTFFFHNLVRLEKHISANTTL